jgi:hypothetical protein
MPDIPIPVALALFALLWFAAGYATRRPRRAPDAADWTAEQAMAQAPTVPPVRGLEPSRFDHTLPAIPPVTEPIPAVEGPVTGDLGAATPEPDPGPNRPMLAIGAPDPGATTKPAESLDLPPAAPTSVAAPPVVLTVSVLPPDGDGTTVHGRRYTLAEHEPMPDGNHGVARTHRALTAEAARTRGKVLITISSRRGYTRIDTPPTGEWPTEPVAAAIQHHRGHTPAPTPVTVLHAVTGDPGEAWAGRW